MGDLVDLERYRRTAHPVRERLTVNGEPEATDPAELGWVVVEKDPAGAALRWFHPRRIAQIGRVPNAPEWVFLDQDDQIRAWKSLDLEGLARALEAQSLPDPEVTLRWDGTVVDHQQP